MADDNDDDEFGLDDALDDLPDDDLYELERHAFLSTQQNPTVAVNSARNRRLQQQEHQESFASDKTLQPNRPPSDYGFDDEDIIDLDEQPLAVQQAYNNQGPTYTGFVDRQGTGPNAPYSGKEEEESYETAVEQPRADIAALQALLQQTQNENLNLRRAIDETKSTVQSKTGENAILRQKLEKQARENHDKQSNIRQLYEEKMAKQKAETERIKSENQKVITDNQFLKHDLSLEAGKAKQFQRNLKAGGIKNGASPLSTPKKQRVLPFRDGFDDDDIIMLSPSKTRSKPSTPKGGTKRKRSANEQSPMQPPQLPLSEPKAPRSASQQPVDVGVASDLLRKLANGKHKLQFLQNFLDHQLENSEERVFEALTGYHFPSAPEKMLSSIVYDRLSARVLSHDNLEISTHFCDILLSIWDQCLKECYYEPMALVIETLQFMFDSESLAFARGFIAKAVPFAIATADIVAIPIARASIARHMDAEQGVALSVGCIDVSACLTLLQTIALAAAPFPDAIAEFWRHMKFDFVLLVLMKAQPQPQIMLMLELLQTSALESTFGAILSDDEGLERQARREADTIDRLTLLLFETPHSAGGDDLDPSQVLEMRIGVLSVLATMCITDYASRALALHRHAIGRLFKFLHDSINDLYHDNSADHALQIKGVNMSMRVIHHLVTQFANIVDIRTKLSSVHGGTHMHLIALTRLAFSERVWFEEGIQTEVMDAAHQLLDEYLSPDEGEALLQMFSSGNSEG